MESFNKVKENLKKNLYPFFDSKNLLSAHKKIKSELNFKFENYIIVGIGGSSQGSKAVSHFLNVKNIFYFDHLNTEKIVRTLSSLNLKNTGFIFISKSGDTSEVLTLFDYIKEVVQDNLDLSKNFLTITENSTSPLYNLSTHLGIRIIEHHKGIGGRFSIFSHTGMVPISLFFNKTEDFYEGLDSALSRFLAYNVNDTSDGKTYSPVQTALRKYDLINKGKKIGVILLYGDELFELGNWMKQLYAESLGKKGFGYLPVISKMTQDQHSLLQLYLDGPKDKFFEFYSVNYLESNNFINIALSNHKDALLKTLESEKLPIVKISNYFTEDNHTIGFQLGYFFAELILETLLLAEMGNVDPFGQDAIEKQKNFLKKV